MCGQGIVQLSTGSYPVFIRNRSYLLSGVDAVRCDECGEVFATPEEAKVLNRQPAIPSGKRNISSRQRRSGPFARNTVYLRADLEAILHVAPKSVVR